MTLEELIAQWRRVSSTNRDASPDFALGLRECADELQDWLRVHKGETV